MKNVRITAENAYPLKCVPNVKMDFRCTMIKALKTEMGVKGYKQQKRRDVLLRTVYPVTVA